MIIDLNLINEQIIHIVEYFLNNQLASLKYNGEMWIEDNFAG